VCSSDLFVRHRLGCSCGDEVFQDIRVLVSPAVCAGVRVAAELRIGGRLLVWLVPGGTLADLATALPALVAGGRERRDRGGFNRFRLVLGLEDASGFPALERGFRDSAGDDPRLHLHLLAPSLLAELLGATAG
jgi:hypothetical protein